MRTLPQILFGAIFCVAVTPTFGYLAQLAARLPLPGTPAPLGSPWPKPVYHESNMLRTTISSRDFKFESDIIDCPILTDALERYDAQLLFRNVDVQPAPSLPVLSNVRVILPASDDNLCNNYPKLASADDAFYESYNVSVVEDNNEGHAVIEAATIWGALHGIETFSQLIWKGENENHFYVNLTTIHDSPRLPHRGFMLDTARHYVDLPVIQTIIDGMAYNKLNVFHWHIVDDQSFPFVSQRYPELSEKGAYLPNLVYEPAEVQGIIEYARYRGIRVILEFDTPGHTQGFGKAFPEILTPCYGQEGQPGTPDYPNHAAFELLDPTNEMTFEVMSEFFAEIKNVSKDEFVHLGIDESYYACWKSSPVVAQFMQDNNIETYPELLGYYMTRHIEMVKGHGLKPIIWQDPLNDNIYPDVDVVIQVWQHGNKSGGHDDNWVPVMEEILQNGYQGILSSCWYLNYISYGEAWRPYYECDPILQLENATDDQKKRVLGGEAAHWAEFADSTNLVQRIFPFVGAMAERLWSPEFPIDTSNTDDAMHRLDQHRCRLLWRGIPAQPIFNGYCFDDEKTVLMKH